MGGSQPRHGLLGEVEASIVPLIVYLLDNRGREPQQESEAGEDATTLAQRTVWPLRFQSIGAADGAPVLRGKRQV